MFDFNPKTQMRVFMFMFILTLLSFSRAQIRVGFYAKTCPTAESIVHKVVQQAVNLDARNAPKLIRLQFHDCFVEGCDGSILINNGSKDNEINAPGNLGLEGFEIIENAKTELENSCRGVVSCADIVVLAARDAVSLVNGPFYNVPTGRKDGTVSSKSSASNLPEVYDSINLLKSKFAAKGLSDRDLVLLTAGAHTIGRVACFFMTKRLYNFTSKNDTDPTISPTLLPQLVAKCPKGGKSDSVKIPLDWGSESDFDDHIFRNIENNFAILASDASLLKNSNTKRILESYISGKSKPSFFADFAKSMIKMGKIGVKTGSQGIIRRVCNACQ